MLTPKKIERLWREVSKWHRGEVRTSRDVDRGEVLRFARLVEAAALENAANVRDGLRWPKSHVHQDYCRGDLMNRARAARKAAEKETNDAAR